MKARSDAGGFAGEIPRLGRDATHGGRPVNFFSTVEYLEALGDTHFSTRRWAVEVCEIEGRLLRLLVLDGRTPVHEAPFYDFPQPLEVPAEGPRRSLRYYPKTVVQTTGTGEADPERALAAASGLRVSPYVEWARFADRAAFERHCEALGARFSDSRRQRKRLEKEHGPLGFVFDDTRPEVFEAGLRWKGAQYVASGSANLLAEPRAARLMHELRRRGVLLVSSLSAGSTLLAVHVGGLSGGRLGYWLPAYEPAFSKYSPGRILLEELLFESQRRGHVEFDFLIGREDYKFKYATHARWIGPLGEPPRRVRLEAFARRRLKEGLARAPRLRAFVDGLRERIRRPPPAVG